MTSLQQAFSKTQAQWRKLEEGKIPILFAGAATQEIVSTDYDKTDTNKTTSEGGGD